MRRTQRRSRYKGRSRRSRRMRQTKGGERLTLGSLIFLSALSVRFQNGAAATGAIIPLEATHSEPAVSWSPPAPGVFRTLLCVDPDASAPAWLHWLVVNAEGDGPGSGTTFVPWAPPSPPAGTGVHRYYFCLFEHEAAVVAEEKPMERGYFKMEDFVRRNGMRPVAAAMVKLSA
jgi:phosphatidylethanolamine-binding protein (PEBP) family uncharacterized protein